VTAQQLIHKLQALRDPTREIKLQDIATNYIYRVFTIDQDTGVILIEDTEE
jgi:hypothetical protein